MAASPVAGAANGSFDQYQVGPVQPNLRVHNPLPDGTEPECQDAWNSRSIGQNRWKFGIGQEPVQMATEGWSGLQALLGIGWAQIQMADGMCQKCSSLLTCLVSDCLCMRRGGVFQNILIASLEISPLSLKCEICLETRRLNFVWRDYLYMGIKCEFPACICTSKSLALNCLQQVNKE